MADIKKIKWTKIKCSVCGAEKNASEARKQKLIEEGKLDTYKCMECRRKEKEEL